mmetsp:Transcript_18815/g.60525  ORF Transcript_18815/g.60525 Transcript_18815/m.60525 type:complete len:405 (-) Transcript_18815:65-1279(-)
MVPEVLAVERPPPGGGLSHVLLLCAGARAVIVQTWPQCDAASDRVTVADLAQADGVVLAETGFLLHQLQMLIHSILNGEVVGILAHRPALHGEGVRPLAEGRGGAMRRPAAAKVVNELRCCAVRGTSLAHASSAVKLVSRRIVAPPGVWHLLWVSSADVGLVVDRTRGGMLAVALISSPIPRRRRQARVPVAAARALLVLLYVVVEALRAQEILVLELILAMPWQEMRREVVRNCRHRDAVHPHELGQIAAAPSHLEGAEEHALGAAEHEVVLLSDVANLCRRVRFIAAIRGVVLGLLKRAPFQALEGLLRVVHVVVVHVAPSPAHALLPRLAFAASCCAIGARRFCIEIEVDVIRARHRSERRAAHRRVCVAFDGGVNRQRAGRGDAEQEADHLLEHAEKSSS